MTEPGRWIDFVLELTGSGVMFTAIIFFSLIWRLFRSDVYRAVAILCGGTLLFTLLSALSRFLLSASGIQAAFEAFRLRELVATGYLFILPYFMASTIKGPAPLRRFHRVLAWAGLGIVPALAVVTYAFPRAFLHGPFGDPSGMVSAGMGPLYLLFQALIGAELLYGMVIAIIDAHSWKSFGKSMSLLFGMLLCAWMAVSDITRGLFGFFIDPLAAFEFSRTILGMVILSAFMAWGFSRSFLRQALDVSKSRDALEETEGRLKAMLYTDDFTGLPNRRKFILDLRASMEGGGEAVIILMDLDSFMEFNECFGSATGDAILKAASAAIGLLLPANARFYRMGGDEFSVILPEGRRKEDVVAMAREIRDRAGQGFSVEGRNYPFGLAMSIARVPHDGDTPEEALSNAYSALNEAKKNRNSICDYSDVLKREALVRISMVQRLRESLRQGSFHMVYQPIHDRDGRVSSAEALLRWEPAGDGEPVSPALFIPLLESSGLMPEMGELIVKLIIQDLGERLAGGGEFPVISINLSPHQLRTDGLGQALHERFLAAGVFPERIQYEVTESAFLDRGSVSVSNLSYLRDKGSAIAVDDFGTGYSNLGYLRSLPIDKLKIDQVFMRSVPGDPSAEGLLTAMADIARSFGLELLAEGVETDGQRAFLHSRGYQEFQGYFFSRPLRRDAFLDYLSKVRA